MSLNRCVSLAWLAQIYREHDYQLSYKVIDYRVRPDGAPDRQYSPNLL